MAGKILSVLIVTTVVFFGINYLLKPKTTEAAWFNDLWTYRQRVDITNSGSAQTEFQVSITLDTATLITAGKMKANCDDIRLTDPVGKTLPHWIEEGSAPCNSATTKIWTMLPSIPTTGNTVYIYYGNPSATNIENGKKIFNFFDNFNNPNIDSSTWAATGGYNIGGGTITIYTGSVYTKATILSDAKNYIYEYRNKWSSTSATYSGFMIADAQSTQGSNAGSNKLIYFMTETSALNTTSWAANGTAASYNITGGATQYTATADTYYLDGFSLDSTNVRFFNNNSQTNSYTGTWTAAPYFWIGAFQGSASGASDIRDLTVDWVRVRKFSATAPTVASPTNEEKSVNPIFYWKLDDGAGASTQDSTQNNNDGTITGATWQPDEQCVSGKCLLFNGTSDYITGTLISAVSRTATYSFSGWVRPATTDGITTVFQNSISASDRNALSISSGNLIFGYWDGASWSGAAGAISANKWSHIAGTNNSGTLKLYINGVLQTGSGSPYVGVSANLLIGKTSTGGQEYYFKGSMDELKFFNYVLSAAQVKADFSAKGGASGKGTTAQLGKSARNSDALSNGLIGYWKMDENTGTTTADASGNSLTGNLGTGNSAPAWTTGKFGYGLDFDGVGDTVITSTSQSQTSQKTICAWVQPDSSSGLKGLVIQENGYYLRLNSMYLEARVLNSSAGVSSSYTSATALTANQWAHVCEVVDATSSGPIILSFFINGSLDYTVNTDVIGPNTGASGSNLTTFGNDNDSTGRFFPGNLDEIRVYNRALSSTEIQQLYNFAPGPVGHWKLDEKTGQTAADASGNNNSATLGANSSAGADDPTWISAKYGGGLQFDGSNDYAFVTDPASGVLDFGTGNFTIETWLKFPLAGSFVWNGIISKGYSTTGPANTWGLTTGNPATGLAYGDTVDAGGSFNASYQFTNLPTSGFHHIAVTRENGTAYKFYIDGILNGSQTSGATATLSNSSNLQFGNGDSRYLNSSLDDIRIYNYTRTPRQIIEDINAGNPIGGSPVGTQIGYWKLDEGYGGSVSDSSAQKISGTLGVGSSAPSWSENGKYGKTLSFDGNDFVSFGSTTLNSAIDDAQDFTVTAWIKPTAVSGNQTIFGDRYSSGMTILLSGNKLMHDMDDDNVTGNISISAGVWTHVAVTFKGADASHISKLYVNGVFDNSGVNHNIGVSTAALYLGHERRFSFNFTGLIDEVKVYNGVLTGEEIKQDYNRGSAIVLGSLSDNSSYDKNSANQEYCVPGDTTSCAAPVGEWKFEEKTNTNAYDTSGNGNTGTITGATWSTGRIGSALAFNGSSDFISTSITTHPSSFTTEAWVNTDVTDGTYDTIISKFTASPSYNGFFMRHANGNIEAAVYNAGSGYTSTTTITANGWNYWVMTFDGSTIRLYKDGIQVDSDAGTMGSNSTALVIGGNYGGASERFDGKIDQVRYFTYTRTPAQIAWDYNRGKPVAHWKFDECQGGTAFDSSGNRFNGTITIGGTGTQSSVGTCATASTAWGNGATGKQNYSLNFDGADDYVGSIASIPTLTSFSVSAWAKPTGSSRGGVVDKFHLAGGAYAGFALSYGVNTLNKFSFLTGDGTNYSWQDTTTTYAVGSWYHVVGVYDGATKYLYVNGVLAATNSVQTYSHASENLAIGTNYANSLTSWPFTGQIDDVRVYNYALTATQIKTLYSNGAVNFAPATGTP